MRDGEECMTVDQLIERLQEYKERLPRVRNLRVNTPGYFEGVTDVRFVAGRLVLLTTNYAGRA